MTSGFDYAARGLQAPATRPAIPGGGPQTAAGVLDRFLDETPDGEALVDRHARYTYAELDDAVNRAARALEELGVGPGERVAASLPNGAEITLAFLAAMRLGAIWVGVHRALAPPEKAYLLRDSQARVLLTDAATARALEPERPGLPDLRHLVLADPGDRTAEWAQLLEAAAGAPRPAHPVDPFAPAAIAYTSGTTGFPKGAVHSQHNLLLPGAVTAVEVEWPPGLRSGVCLPMTILNLMVLGPLLAYQSGGCCIAMDRVDALGIAHWVRDERIASFSAVPAMVHDLLTHPEVSSDDLATLVRPGVGGADCPESFRKLYRERFGGEVTIGYGLTEAPTTVAATDPREAPIPGSCGRPRPHVEIRALSEDGEAVATGEVGEVCVRAAGAGRWKGVYTPMLGYWNRPEASAEALRGGWLHTGDLGCFDAEGHLYIRDRQSDLILRGGANVYPAEVERVLCDDPRVAACAVLGRPDPRLGERVVAVVQLEPGASADADDLSATCRENLARYKVPAEFHFVSDLPRTPMGKVRRRDLRERFAGPSPSGSAVDTGGARG